MAARVSVKSMSVSATPEKSSSFCERSATQSSLPSQSASSATSLNWVSRPPKVVTKAADSAERASRTSGSPACGATLAAAAAPPRRANRSAMRRPSSSELRRPV